MSTSLKNMIRTTKAFLLGTSWTASGSIVAAEPAYAAAAIAAGVAVAIDNLSEDLSKEALAKNGAFTLALTASTPITIDLTSISSTATSSAGDNVFATWNDLNFNNTGAQDVIVSVGSSNPARLPLAGTNPTLTVPAGSNVRLQSVAGFAIDSTHKTIKFDPGGSAASIDTSIGGA